MTGTGPVICCTSTRSPSSPTTMPRRTSNGRTGSLPQTAVLELLAAAARARVVPAHLLLAFRLRRARQSEGGRPGRRDRRHVRRLLPGQLLHEVLHQPGGVTLELLHPPKVLRPLRLLRG